jgi:hypothetical protein
MNIELPLDGTARDKLRPVSKALYGSDFVLEALLVMAQEPRFFGGQLATLSGCEGSYASGLLKRFVEVRLIETLPKEPGQSRKYYRTLPSPLWEASVALAQSLLTEPHAGVSHLPSRR